MTTGVLVTAAGFGLRLDADRPKALVSVCGRPLVAHCVARLNLAGFPAPLVLAPAGHVAAFRRALDTPDTQVADVIEGGVLRRHSIERGVAWLAGSCDTVLVHDAARAFTPPDVIAAAHARVSGDVVACAPAESIADTVKQVSHDTVVTTLDRDTLALIHTPQVFQRDALLRALYEARDTDTDELAPLERLIARGDLAGRVATVPSSPFARKVTTPDDVVFFTALLPPMECDS